MKSVYILADGLSENTARETSLEQTDHRNLDILHSSGTSFLFEPVQAKNMFHPATYYIFPFFFGLRPERNPGRAALELYENGIDISRFNSFAVFRVINTQYDVRRGWYEKTESLPLDLVSRIISRVGKEKYLDALSSVIVKSRISHNIWCIGSETEDSLEFMLNTLPYEFSQHGFNVYPTLISNISAPVAIERGDCARKEVLGWMVGPTEQAFRLLGFVTDRQKCHTPDYVFDFENKFGDFQLRVLPAILQAAEDSVLIIYVKETSSAAKKNYPEKKKQAIGFIDRMVGEMLVALQGTETNIIIISDHQSNIGVPYVYPGPSLACVYNTRNHEDRGFLPFTERNIGNRIEKVLSQEECVEAIKRIVG